MPTPAKDEGAYMFFDTENSNKLTSVRQNAEGVSAYQVFAFDIA
jgi:hypothetical protein